MARPLRIEFPGAIYHLMARGNARQRIFTQERDYERLTEGLGQTVVRCGWELFRSLLRRAARALAKSKQLRDDTNAIRQHLLKAKNEA